MKRTLRLAYRVIESLRSLLIYRAHVRACSLFFLLFLSGCHRISFQPEQIQAQELAKEITGQDIDYGEAGHDTNVPVLPQELSRDEAIRIALLNNKDIRASLYELGITKTTLADAVLFQNPVISFSSPSPLNAAESLTAINYLQVDSQILNLPDLVQIPMRRRMYSAQLEIAVYTFVNKMIEITAQTRQAYDKVLLNRALIENRDNSLQINKDEISTKRCSPDNQKETHKRHVKTLAEITDEIAKLSFMKELVTSFAELGVLLGVNQDYVTSVKLSSSLTEPMTPLPRLEALLSWAESSHVEMVIGQKKIEYAVESLAYEKSKLFDRASIGTTYFKDFATDRAGVGIYFLTAVPLFHQNQPRIVQAEYSVEKSRRELEDKRTKIKASLCIAYEKIMLQMRIVECYQKQRRMVHTELTDHLKKLKKEINVNSLYRAKKQLKFNELTAKSLEAYYQLLELYTALEKICGKRLFFAQRTVISRYKGAQC